MAPIKLFPIGYVASSNADSKGAWTSGGTSKNEMFEPNDVVSKRRLGHTIMDSELNRAISSRKISDYKHTINYKYNNMWSGEYRMIKRFITHVANDGADSFYLVDWSSGIRCTSVASAAGIYTAYLSDTTGYAATPNYGANYIFLWNADTKKFRTAPIQSIDSDTYIKISGTGDYGDLGDYVRTEVADENDGRPELIKAHRIISFVDGLAFANIRGLVASPNKIEPGRIYGSNLFRSGYGEFSSNTEGWLPYGTNAITVDGGKLRITAVDSTNGAYILFRESVDISEDAVVGNTYLVSFDAKVATSTEASIGLWYWMGGITGEGRLLATISTATLAQYSSYVVADSESSDALYCDIPLAKELWLDNVKIQKVVNSGLQYFAADSNDYRITLGDANTKVARGWIDIQDDTETLATELITDGVFNETM